MKQFIFEDKIKKVLIAFMVLGVLCLIGSYFSEPEQLSEAGFHSRFWSNFLHNAAYFAGIGFIITFVIAAFTTAYSGWHIAFKRVMEAFSTFLYPGIILMLLLGISVYLHINHLYHWADSEAVAADRVLAGKSGFLNRNWYLFGTLIIGGIWSFFAWKFRQLSLQEDKEGKEVINYFFQRRTRFFAAIFLPIAAFTGPALIWQWLMSVDAHWYSTLYAWYTMASWFLGAISMLILVIIFLKSKGYLENVTIEHLHDLGKFMFGFSIFWTYCWFSQYMLIWYGNVGEETIYYKERLDNYPVLFYGNLVINFVLPFLILMRNTTKRRIGTLVFSSILVFLGHWWDFFYLIKPGTFITAKDHLEHAANGGAHEAGAHSPGIVMGFTIPGLLEIGIMLGFLAFFLFWVFHQLSKAPLLAQNDPYLEESLHHEVQPYD
jgi:hypothetical protein